MRQVMVGLVALIVPQVGLALDAGAATGLLPAGAQVLEVSDVPAKAGLTRALVLWMEKPARHPREESDPTYTCPEYSRGHYYSGPVRLSLVDPKASKVVQTLKIAGPEGKDSLDVPYKIQPGYYYAVPGVKQPEEGTPRILNLEDHTSQGQKADFVLYESEACTGPLTTLLGYRVNSDKLVQYPVELKVKAGAGDAAQNDVWVDTLFLKTAQGGHAAYQQDYRGRGGTLDSYDVRFDPARERFTGSLTRQTDE